MAWTMSWMSSLHMVSAWGSEQRLVLGQIAVDEKSNEITAVPKLLTMLSLDGTIVTADARTRSQPVPRFSTATFALPAAPRATLAGTGRLQIALVDLHLTGQGPAPAACTIAWRILCSQDQAVW